MELPTSAETTQAILSGSRATGAGTSGSTLTVSSTSSARACRSSAARRGRAGRARPSPRGAAPPPRPRRARRRRPARARRPPASRQPARPASRRPPRAPRPAPAPAHPGAPPAPPRPTPPAPLRRRRAPRRSDRGRPARGWRGSHRERTRHAPRVHSRAEGGARPGPRSDVDHDVSARPRAAGEDVALGRRIERLGVVGDAPGDQPALARVTDARPAGPAHRHVAGFGQLEQAPMLRRATSEPRGRCARRRRADRSRGRRSAHGVRAAPRRRPPASSPRARRRSPCGSGPGERPAREPGGQVVHEARGPAEIEIAVARHRRARRAWRASRCPAAS